MRSLRPIDRRVQPERRLRRNMTDAERKLWQYLRQLPQSSSHFRRQATIAPYFADFACHSQGLIIEVDGASIMRNGRPRGTPSERTVSARMVIACCDSGITTFFPTLMG
jgi:very-short-patch-repair endonuclease